MERQKNGTTKERHHSILMVFHAPNLAFLCPIIPRFQVLVFPIFQYSIIPLFQSFHLAPRCGEM